MATVRHRIEVRSASQAAATNVASGHKRNRGDEEQQQVADEEQLDLDKLLSPSSSPLTGLRRVPGRGPPSLSLSCSGWLMLLTVCPWTGAFAWGSGEEAGAAAGVALPALTLSEIVVLVGADYDRGAGELKSAQDSLVAATLGRAAAVRGLATHDLPPPPTVRVLAQSLRLPLQLASLLAAPHPLSTAPSLPTPPLALSSSRSMDAPERLIAHLGIRHGTSLKAKPASAGQPGVSPAVRSRLCPVELAARAASVHASLGWPLPGTTLAVASRLASPKLSYAVSLTLSLVSRAFPEWQGEGGGWGGSDDDAVPFVPVGTPTHDDVERASERCT